jgi:CitMHS family citrate-Mg2+:H+ or citrate-Ca2+:H+ symporter
VLALAGLATILLVLAAILARKLSPLAALAGIPLAMAIVLGQGASAGGYIMAGMATVAPVAAMFLFAILFFGILMDAGLFQPIIDGIVRLARGHPPRIAVGTAILASAVHLDGSGAVTFMICIPALLPLYDRTKMDRRLLTAIVAMAAGVGNMLPWGGPTIRAATALQVPVMTFFRPMIPVYGVGFAAVLLFAWLLGRRELARIGEGASVAPLGEDTEVSPRNRSRVVHFVNAALVVIVLALMVSEALPPAVAFLIGTVAAMLVNLRMSEQRLAVERHAPAAITMVAILFAAGAFTGILKGTGMLPALAHAGADVLPAGAGAHLAPVVAVLAMPLSLLFDPDSFYFGVLPVLGGIADASGASAVDVGRAAIIGQMTTGFPVSPLTPATFLLVGLAGVELSDHQRLAIPLLFALSLIMAVAALALGVFPL